MVPRGGLISALQSISPTEFENVVYDLVSVSGLRNAVWRTPGADGGRDIEGEYPVVDFSGYHRLERWYVECKRYESSVDWPTVWEKIAYADVAKADYLLVVTTASLSPACKTQISEWNAQGRRLAVRFWDGTVLESILIAHPKLLIKHGLVQDARLIASSFLSLAQQSSRIVQAAYGHAEIAGQENSALEAASAFAELLTVRLRDVEIQGKAVTSGFSEKEDVYSWLKLSGQHDALRIFDRYGLRAILAFLRHVTKMKDVPVSVEGHIARIDVSHGIGISSGAVPVLTELATWCNLEMRVEGSSVVLQARNKDAN